MESVVVLRGSLLIGSLLNMALFTIEVALAITFFSRPGGGRQFYYYLVTGLLVNDFVCTIAGCAGGWMSLIELKGSVSLFAWPIPIVILSTSLSAVVEQLFLIYRYHSLSKNVPISASLCALIVIHATFYFMTAIYLAVHLDFSMHNMGGKAATVATSVCAAADVLIPAALVWQLRQMKTSFQSTNGLIRRLSVNTISSGCGVSIFGITLPILLHYETNVIVTLVMMFGRLYSLTILVNLVVTKSSRRNASSNSDTGIHTDGDLENSVPLADNLHVHRSAIIRVKDNSPGGVKGTLILESTADAMPSTKSDF